MADVEGLIRAYKSQKPTTTNRQEYAGKTSIIQELANQDDSRVLPFFLEVVSDDAGYDLARIDILQRFAFGDYSNQQREAIGQVIQRLLLDSSDGDIRDHAAIAIAEYMDIAGSINAVETTVSNPAESINLRHNALAALEQMGPTDRTMEVMRRLTHDDQLGQSAAHILNDWP